MVQTSIIILNWNGWSDTKECLQSLNNSTEKSFHIFLIDNGSANDYEKMKVWADEYYSSYIELTADEIDDLKDCRAQSEAVKNHASLFLIKSRENLGFAKGNNLGIKLAKMLHMPFVYLLNNDTIVPKDSLLKLFVFAEEHPEFTAIVPQIRYNRPADTIWCCGGELNGFYEYYHYKDEQYYNLPLVGYRPITFATGCALLLRNNEFDFLSENFFFGEEDFELSLRFKKQYKKMACLFDSIIYHKESASIDKSAKYLNKMFIHRLNRFIDIKTYAPATSFFIITYRSFKFFLVNLMIEKTGLFKAIKNSLLLFKMALSFNEVNKQTFEKILNLPLK